TGASIATGASAAAPAKRRIKIAVKYSMVQEDLSLMDKFKLLRDLGFDGVEVYTRNRNEERAYLAATEKSGLPIHGVVNASEPDIISAVKMADTLGASSVLILAREDPKLSYDQNFRHWQNLVITAIPIAKKCQVRLLIENVRATFLKTAEGMVRFIESFQDPIVGSYYDTGNTITWTKQSAEHWAKVLGNHIGRIDVKDRGHREFGNEKLKSKTAMGTNGGEVHWQNVRKELRKIDYQGWGTAEVAGGDRHRLARMAKWMDDVLGNSTPSEK
ncbi:MAG: sugar phosphate isomerase/epimerase family protein, partial [Limisphaerales bacterium]